MAYPVMPNVLRAQVVMQHVSGLPEHVYVNNLYFREYTPGTTWLDYIQAVTDRLDQFYSTAHGTSSIHASLPDTITGVQYKFYDLGQPTPRYPIVPPVQASWQSGLASERLPEEVALCISFVGENLPPNLSPPRRRKGRIYIGPLRPAAATQAGEWVRPASTVVNDFVASAQWLAEQNGTESLDWIVASPTAASQSTEDNAGVFPVAGVWVDDAFDTQRSRGAEPSARTTWGNMSPP